MSSNITALHLQNQQPEELLSELQEREQRLRSIFETALDAVVTMNPTGEITEWNAEAENIFGWSRQEAVGRRMSDTIIPPQYQEAHERGLQRFLHTGEGPLLNKRIEITAVHRTGRKSHRAGNLLREDSWSVDFQRLRPRHLKPQTS